MLSVGWAPYVVDGCVRGNVLCLRLSSDPPERVRPPDELPRSKVDGIKAKGVSVVHGLGKAPSTTPVTHETGPFRDRPRKSGGASAGAGLRS